MKIVRVTKEEFELDDGSVFPIIPTLEKEMTPDEFQKHYDGAFDFVEGLKRTWGGCSDAPSMGRLRANTNHTD
jgi:hypothetical protein